jgi:predicted ribosome quality control (RQC) complex YloA/Tae2 family protein
MSFDGVFIHYLVDELQSDLLQQRIHHIFCFNQTNYVFVLNQNKQFIISMQPDQAHMRMSSLEFVFDIKTSPLLNMLKKHLEGGIITDIKQIDNDRLVILSITNENIVGEKNQYSFIMEFFGRNANCILVDSEMVVIECQKKIFTLGEKENRIMLPKITYTFPSNEKKNPYFETELKNQNQYTGVSSLLFSEMQASNDLNIIYSKKQPIQITTANKMIFYCFDLPSVVGERIVFPSLSLLLESFFTSQKSNSTANTEQKQVESFIKKEITKLKNKLEKQKQEFKTAEENLVYEQYGNILSSYLHQVKKGESQVTLTNYYNNNEPITIFLDPLLDPKRNLQNMFIKYKKSKRALTYIDQQITITKQDLEYYECLSEQIAQAKNNETREIMQELGMGKTKEIRKKQTKPQLTMYQDEIGNKIYVGKNNIQNNYLTHSFAKKNDFFFHIKDSPGSHTILQTSQLTNDAILLAAHIAAYYSKKRLSSQVAVDYTMIKYVKKVPKTKGSFVTYTQQKTIYVTPDDEFIKTKATKKS